MSRSSKSQSGLSTIRRDFSSSEISQLPKSSQEIHWPPSPPVAPSAPVKKLSGSEARLKAIQEALAGYPTSSSPLPVQPSSENKRPSPTGSSATGNPPTKRARQLPPDWPGADSLSRPSLSSKPLSSRSRDIGRSTSITPASTSSSSSSTKAKLPSVFLSQEQTQILKLVQNGDSVFYTGSAGTGKSVLLREIIKALRKKHVKSSDAVAITASTGIAACNIGGVTIHSFAGIGLGVEPAQELVKKIKKNKKAATRWLRTKVLIIDEVSMLDGDLFDKLANIASMLRAGTTPFGGIQVIVTGDFFQLPPVTKGAQQVKFAFEAEMWKQTVKHTFNLTKVFRQSDQTFVDMLNEMRFGNLSAKSIQTFKRLSREIEYDDGLGPTELFPRREDVERSNSTRMSRLNTHEGTFAAKDGGTIQDSMQKEKMLSNFMAPKFLRLRIDAQVMLIKNADDTLVNGSMGRVLRFVDEATFGTLDDPDFQPGDGVLGSGSAVNIGSVAKKPNAAPGERFPVVEFVLPNGSKRRALVTRDIWKVELPSGEVQVSRSQLPLILAWAMSIHKSQGQTLERVKVDLGKVFEKGQAYVALSRATSLDGLQVLNFDASKVQAHPKVIAWSKTLSTISEHSS